MERITQRNYLHNSGHDYIKSGVKVPNYKVVDWNDMTRQIRVTNPDRFDANGNHNERPPKVQRIGYQGKNPRP